MVAECGGAQQVQQERTWHVAAAGDARARRRWDAYRKLRTLLHAGIQLIRAPGCDAWLPVVM